MKNDVSVAPPTELHRSATTLKRKIWTGALGLISLLPAGIVHLPAERAAAQPPQESPEVQEAWRLADPLIRQINLGVARMEQYDYTAAVEEFEKAVEIAPHSVEARVNLAMAVYNRAQKQDAERAEQLLAAVLEQEPENLQALFFRGLVDLNASRDEAALPAFQKVVEASPHDAYAWYLLARCKAHLEQPYLEELERAIRENPYLASAYYDLLLLSARSGKKEEARTYQKKFSQLQKNPLCDMVVVPQYRQMGPLSLAQPIRTLPRPITGGKLEPDTTRVLYAGAFVLADAPPAGPIPDASKGKVNERGVVAALADCNGDGYPDMVVTAPTQKSSAALSLLIGTPDGTFRESTENSGLGRVQAPMACAFGDYDNDGVADLFISCRGPNHLFRGNGDGTFEDVTNGTRTAGLGVASESAIFLDADHDGDLDLYVCNSLGPDGKTRAANQLLNNNADGTFTDIADSAGVACNEDRSVMVATADLDNDRDTDLIVFNADTQARVFLNDRLGIYHEGSVTDGPVRSRRGGVAQDFNGDGRPDILAFPDRLYLTDGSGVRRHSKPFEDCVNAVRTYDQDLTARIADVDLDGDLDVLLLGRRGHTLLNDGFGRFVTRAQLWTTTVPGNIEAVEIADLSRDGRPDVVCVTDAQEGAVRLLTTVLTPPAHWLAVSPTGMRGKDKATRSPAGGFGTRLELRCGLHSQTILHTGQSGGRGQSQLPVVFGMSSATRADYLALTWPDGVTQSEIDVSADTHHRIQESQRKASSCPVLFSWNGEHFQFVGDFAGVGGLGYFVAPGAFAPPQPEEHVKIEPDQLAPRNGYYELRICEPMEEVAYVDRLELLAIDHPGDVRVFPDERLAVSGPPPAHNLLCIRERMFPRSATNPSGRECAPSLREVDRQYAYEPPIDRRFIGFCERHSLVLSFDDPHASLPVGKGLYLFINGSIEYPYSQTTYAADQARVRWEPLRIEQRVGDEWETLVPDAGAPGGMGRMITVDLSGKLRPGPCELRISTNLEIYFDQMYLAFDQGTKNLTVYEVPLVDAELRRLGFPLEHTPDGRMPWVYTYDVIMPTSSFKLPAGSYTSYGHVEELLGEFDDRYVIMGTGDELAVRFRADDRPVPREGWVRSFVLISHAYCKDMDLYTAEPDTVSPLPFKDMSAYPYGETERYPTDDAFRAYRERYNTRNVE